MASEFSIMREQMPSGPREAAQQKCILLLSVISSCSKWNFFRPMWKD